MLNHAQKPQNLGDFNPYCSKVCTSKMGYMKPDELLTLTTEYLTCLAQWAADGTLDGLGGQSDEVLLSVLRQTEVAAKLVGAIQVQTAAIVEERSAFGAISDGLAFKYGHSRASLLIEHITGVSQTEAKRRVRMGKHIRSRISISGELLPPIYSDVAIAVEQGLISVGVAERIIQGLDQARKHHIPGENEQPGEFEENLLAAEQSLVEQATLEPADSVAVQILAWRDALDPDGAPVRDEEVRGQRGLRIVKVHNGVTWWEWRTTADTTAMIKALLEDAQSAAIPRFMPTTQYNDLERMGLALTDPDETAALLAGATDQPNTANSHNTAEQPTEHPTDGVDCDEYGIVIAVKDDRSHEQRDNDVLDGFLRAGIRASADEMGGMKPIVEVTAIATLADLEAGRGVGWIDGIDEPVSIDHIKELACGSGYRLMILGDAGEVLWLGKKPRYFSSSQKKAVVLRDGPTCAAGGCKKPARQCDVHHVEFHSNGGPTDVDNAILFCSEHHHMIHKSPFTIKMHNGLPHILAPRWLDPRQTWKPMGRARHRSPGATRIRA